MLDEIDFLTQTFRDIVLQGGFFEIIEKGGKLDYKLASTARPSIQTHNILTLSNWLIEKIKYIDIAGLSYPEFSKLQESIDLCYWYGRKLCKSPDRSLYPTNEIMTRLVALKIGGQIPYEKLLTFEYQEFYKFIKNSYLHHKLFAMRLPLTYSEELGPSIPIEISDKVTQYIPWKRLEKRSDKINYWFYKDHLLFTTGENGALTADYSCHRWGIKTYHPFQSTSWEVFDHRDPSLWNSEYRLEVKTIFSSDPDDNPPFFLGIHAYINLKNPKGEVRSVGQDMLEHYHTSSYWEMLSRKTGSDKIEFPDAYEFYPKYCRHNRDFIFILTESQYDSIIDLVEMERRNPSRWASVCQGNCVSFVLNILKRCLNVEIDASFHGLHVYFRQYARFKWYRRWYNRYYKWYQALSPGRKKLLLFFPLYYIFAIVLGSLASLMTFNSFGKKRDFTLFDVFFRPWKIACHHPLKLYLALKEAAGPDGIIHAPSEQPKTKSQKQKASEQPELG